MKLETSNEIKMAGATRAGVVGCMFMLAAMYFLLLGPNQTIFSVYILCEKTRMLCDRWQFLVFCLLPIYFSLMIFGGGATGWLLGRTAHRWFVTHEHSAAH